MDCKCYLVFVNLFFTGSSERLSRSVMILRMRVKKENVAIPPNTLAFSFVIAPFYHLHFFQVSFS